MRRLCAVLMPFMEDADQPLRIALGWEADAERNVCAGLAVNAVQDVSAVRGMVFKRELIAEREAVVVCGAAFSFLSNPT